MALTAWAGFWQLDRAHQKEGLRAAFERGAVDPPIQIGDRPVAVADLFLHRARAEGEFVPDGMVLLDNKVRGGIPGYEVVMPLKLAGTKMHVLVNRGWIPATDRRTIPQVVTPDGKVVVAGLAVLPSKSLELGTPEPQGPILQNLSPQAYARRTGLLVQPVILQQESATGDGLQRAWPAPDFGEARHYGYAVQWFLLCGLIAFLLVFFHVKKQRRDER